MTNVFYILGHVLGHWDQGYSKSPKNEMLTFFLHFLFFLVTNLPNTNENVKI